MQRLSEIQALLAEAGVKPRRKLGQSFLIDGNLMAKLVDLAELTGSETVLEVGSGTGSLTEELLARAQKVVAVEIDPALADLLIKKQGGQEKLSVICGDVLAGKHRISPDVLTELPATAHLVANLPYSIATPLVAESLLGSWRVLKRGQSDSGCLFERLTFTVQKEVADKLCTTSGGKNYGPISVLVALLGQARMAATIPPDAFWPRPKVMSKMVRIDFDADRAGKLSDAETLTKVLALTFGHRRKQIHSAARRKQSPFDGDAFYQALAAAGIDPSLRAERVSPQQFLTLANKLSGSTPRTQR